VAVGVLLVAALAGGESCQPEAAEPPSSASVAGQPAAPADRPCVLLITLDTTRADRLGCYGYQGAATPTLDGLAEQGLLFERALTASPVTLPAHTTLLTGLDPIEHGVRDNGLFKASPQLKTLAEIFSAAGYSTAAFVSAYVLSSAYGLTQGFDLYDEQMHLVAAQGVARVERRAAATVNAALAWLESTPPRPWFLWLHFYDPHHPYQPPEPFLSEHTDPYDGEIAYVDKQLGRFLRRYEQHAPLAQTVVVITADHGEGLGEHGENTHGLFLYDSTMRVPLILRYPPLGPPRRIQQQVGVVDVFPTLLELAGLPAEERVAGRSLTAFLADHFDGPGHDIYLETQLPYFFHGLAALEGISSEGHKLVHAPRPELYDLAQDPQENNNLFHDQPDRVAALRQRMEKLRRGLSPTPPDPASDLDPEESARLEALGYVQSLAGEEGGDPKDFVEVLSARTDAIALAQRGEIPAALATIQAVIEEFPQDAGSFAILGRIELLAGNLDAAIEALQKARSDDTAAAMDLAEVYSQKGDFERAVAACDQAIDHSPHYLAAYLRAADLNIEMKSDRERALTYLRRAQRLVKPGTASARDLEQRIAALAE
jgi:arylsulfatase A-like enzyme